MNLFRYTEVWRPHASLSSFMRERGLSFDYRYDEAAEEFFGAKTLLEYDRDNKKGGILWRLTMPLWLLYNVVLAAFVCPLNWLLTGHFQIENRARLFRFSMAWHKKLFD